MASGIKLTQNEFIERAKNNNPHLDFSKAIYVNSKSKITVICPKHGEFIVNANSCFKKITCPKCDLEDRKNNFIKKAKEVHGDKYDYSKVNYIANKKAVEIICPIHGSFMQAPSDHLKGWGCSKCSKKYKPTTEEWVNSVKDLYGGKYDLSKVIYKDNKTPVEVVCPEHGSFYPIPNNYKKGISGCPLCNNKLKHDRFSKTTEQFVLEAKKIHGDKYNYSKVDYYDNVTPVVIICPIHGEFMQQPYVHLQSSNCPKCSLEKKAAEQRITKVDFINRANDIHNNFYDYSKSDFLNTSDKTCIICPKHGEFWQSVSNHLRGYGCPKCRNKNQTKLYNRIVECFPNCKVEYEKHLPWLGLQSLDIYISDINVGIEYDGLQHYQPVDMFGGESTFVATVKRDEMKNQKCKENGCKLFRMKYDYNDEDFNNLVKEIQNIIDLNTLIIN